MTMEPSTADDLFVDALLTLVRLHVELQIDDTPDDQRDVVEELLPQLPVFIHGALGLNERRRSSESAFEQDAFTLEFQKGSVVAIIERLAARGNAGASAFIERHTAIFVGVEKPVALGPLDAYDECDQF